MSEPFGQYPYEPVPGPSRHRNQHALWLTVAAVAALVAGAGAGAALSHSGSPSGDSGSPLANAHGQVTGMDTAASSSYQFGGNGYGGSRSSGSGQPGATQAYATAFLGVAIAPTGNQNSPGVTIEGVESGTPADSAGLADGDVITAVARQQVSSSTSIQQALERYHPGDKVSIAWNDTEGQSHTATVMLASGPAA